MLLFTCCEKEICSSIKMSQNILNIVVRQILAIFCISVALNLRWNCVKGLRVTKIVKETKFEEIWGKLQAKKLFAETTIYKIPEADSSFYVKQRTTGKVQFRFSSRFLVTLTKFIILKRRLGTRLWFYDILGFSWYFLIF